MNGLKKEAAKIYDYYSLEELFFLDEMNYKQAAQLLNISVQTIERIVARGHLQAPGKVIKKADLLNYLVVREKVNLPIDF